MSDIITNLERIQHQISQASEKSGRTPDSVQLLAVSKTYPSEIIQQAYDAGQIHFGENRVQEALDKMIPAHNSWVNNLMADLDRTNASDLYELLGELKKSILVAENKLQNNTANQQD